MWPFSRKPNVAVLTRKGDVSGLVDALSFGDNEVVTAAVQALARLDAPGVVEALTDALGRGVFVAARPLGLRGDAAAIPALIQVFDAPDLMGRSEAQAALVALGATDALARALAEDPRSSVREWALRTLVQLRPPEIQRYLDAALLDPDRNIRSLAVGHGARPTGDLSGVTEPEAVAALGNIGPEAIPALRAALSAPAAMTRREALNGVLRVSARAGGGSIDSLADVLADAVGDPDAAVRRDAATVLGRVSAPLAVAPLRQALSDPEPLVRQEAAEALGVLGDPAALPELRAAAERGEWAAVRALGRLGDRASVPLLIGALQDSRVAGFAAEALGNLGDPAAIPALKAFLARFKPVPHRGDEPDDGDLAREALAKLTGGAG